MRIRKIGAVALATGLAVAGIGALSEGTAGAAKVITQGTLSCASGGQTAIIPGIVLTSAQLPGYPTKPKDKKPKYITTGNGSGCTGTTTSGTQPSSYTLSSKAKGTSRLLVNPNADCNAPGRTAKTKITFNTGAKAKVAMLSEVNNYAFTVAGHGGDQAHAAGTSAVFPPCGSGSAVAIDFAVDHANDRIETRSSGTIPLNGKAYPGKVVKTRSRTTETIVGQLALAQTATGVALLHGDPAHSTFTIGLP
jgi:hypothetical protein